MGCKSFHIWRVRLCKVYRRTTNLFSRSLSVKVAKESWCETGSFLFLFFVAFKYLLNGFHFGDKLSFAFIAFYQIFTTLAHNVHAALLVLCIFPTTDGSCEYRGFMLNIKSDHTIL